MPSEVKAMIPHVTESALTLEFLRPDGLTLETPFSWGVLVAGQERRGAMLRALAQARRTRRALDTLPLGQADVAAIGRAPVRLFVMGEEAWRDFPSWPPPGYQPQRFHLQPGGGLSTELPGESPPDRYRYDPADPTPAIGGVLMSRSGGRADNTRLEARPDVLSYTTARLDRDVEVVGEVSAEIWFRSSLRHADVFARLCDVDPDGCSRNVTRSGSRYPAARSRGTPATSATANLC